MGEVGVAVAVEVAGAVGRGARFDVEEVLARVGERLPAESTDLTYRVLGPAAGGWMPVMVAVLTAVVQDLVRPPEVPCDPPAQA